MKKKFALLLAAAAIVSLAACLGGNTAAENNSNTTSSQNMSEESAAPDTDSPDETQGEEPSENLDTEEGDGKILVAYFSATGNTEGVAQKLADGLGADLYEIVPETPYTSDDLNYSDSSSRSSVEMNDPGARPGIAGSVENMEQYDVVLVGYPIFQERRLRLSALLPAAGSEAATRRCKRRLTLLHGLMAYGFPAALHPRKSSNGQTGSASAEHNLTCLAGQNRQAAQKRKM